ncbi:MAG: hypothetical protein ACPG4N_13010 [Gammaproteobacteria bacterium]
MATTLEEIAAKLEQLSAENTRLRERVEQLEAAAAKPHPAEATVVVAPAAPTENQGGVVRFDHDHAFASLDPTTRINRKQKLLLDEKQSGVLPADSVTLSGAITAIADYQKSNTTDKFGYLMRHPTSANQRTKVASEAVIHSAQLSVTANTGDWTTAYAEFLYDPEQSFGTGTLTDINRNQVQVRRGYLLFGNLDKAPFYVSLGKMSTPFGLTDTPNPFTASTVWHAFGGLAYGANAGYSDHGWDVNFMAVQGGAQFRSANTPVDGSNVPSKLNNFVLDASHTLSLTGEDSLLLGGSYIRGSAYCQDFPITHFANCADNNPAWDVYAQYSNGPWMLQAEYAKTLDEWPGTFNPTIPQFAASKVSSFDIGGKYRTRISNTDVDLSVDFSRFVAGPSGAPWERQDQIVLGIAGYLDSSTKLFGEIITTRGYAPLNFLSGGNLGAGVTHSDRDARSSIFLVGANAAF